MAQGNEGFQHAESTAVDKFVQTRNFQTANKVLIGFIDFYLMFALTALPYVNV